MNKKINFIIINLLAVSVTLGGCSENKAIFDELSSNRLKIVIKGTYESNGPDTIPFNSISTTDPLPDTSSLPAGMELYDDSIYLLASDDEPNTTDDYSVRYPTRFMIDISHMKLGKHKFTAQRQAKTFSLNDSDSFFNGAGIRLKNDDPKHLSSYSYLKLYTRKMIFNAAREYQFGSSGWEPSEDFDKGLYKVYFKEEKVQGYDFNLLQLNSYYDSLKRNASSINRIYPVYVPILGGFTFDRNYDSMVLEVRLMIKNFIKKYETTSSRDSITRVVHFWAFSDWLRDVEKGEYDMGRNLIAVARCYVPELVGAIDGTNSASRSVYVIAIPAGEPLTKYTLVEPAAMVSSGDLGAPVDDIYTFNNTAHNFLSTETNPGHVAREGDIIQLASGDKYYIVEVADDLISFFCSEGLTTGSGISFTVYPASDRSQNPCNLPVRPTRAGKGLYQYLDYYQNFEEYRSEFNTEYSLCDNASYDNPLEYYKEAWLNYEDLVTSFYLPPLAVYVPAFSSYTIENVMPGDYDIYVTNIADLTADERYGKLFYSNEFVKVNTLPVSIETGQTETVNVP